MAEGCRYQRSCFPRGDPDLDRMFAWLSSNLWRRSLAPVAESFSTSHIGDAGSFGFLPGPGEVTLVPLRWKSDWLWCGSNIHALDGELRSLNHVSFADLGTERWGGYMPWDGWIQHQPTWQLEFIGERMHQVCDWEEPQLVHMRKPGCIAWELRRKLTRKDNVCDHLVILDLVCRTV